MLTIAYGLLAIALGFLISLDAIHVDEVGWSDYLWGMAQIYFWVVLIGGGILSVITSFFPDDINKKGIVVAPLVLFIASNWVATFTVPFDSRMAVYSLFGASPEWIVEQKKDLEDTVYRVAVRKKAYEHYRFDERLNENWRVDTKKGLEVRSAPHESAPVVSRLKQGQQLMVFARTKGAHWYLTGLPDSSPAYIYVYALVTPENTTADGYDRSIIDPVSYAGNKQKVSPTKNMSPVKPSVKKTNASMTKTENNATKKRAAELVSDEELAKSKAELVAMLKKGGYLDEETDSSGLAVSQAARQKQKAQRLISRFEFPDDGCRVPRIPSINASGREIDRANKDLDRFYRCQSDAYDEDREAVAELVKEIGGQYSEVGKKITWELPAACECMSDITELMQQAHRRMDGRTRIADRLDYEVGQREERADNAEFWDNMNDMVDRATR